MTFPQDFKWGAATSSYQIEGAVFEDGRGECIWTRFAHTPGNVRDNQNADIACDHYHRYPEDIALLKQIGVNAYRFSTAWARVLPDGTGKINPKGLAFYDRLIDGLLEAGITPFLTLYHWDLPQVLQDKGGWANRDVIQWFAEYAELMARTYGDRVQHWTTHNEPYVIAFVGHWEGRHAPGIQDLPTAYKVAHHLLLSHAEAVPVIRAHVPSAQVGIVLDIWQSDPFTPNPIDVDAAMRFDAYHNRWFLDPIFRGEYPADLVEWLGNTLTDIDLAEVQRAQVPIDYLGINYYTRGIMRHTDEPPFEFERVLPDVNTPQTTMQWEVYPQGLTQILHNIHANYQPKAIYITENGSAWDDAPPTGDVLEDPQRVAYLHQHLQVVEEALAAGIPMAGYFAWSLLDNFEWGHGYHQRFGIIHVDYATQKRTLKRSALAYGEFIRQKGLR